MRSSVCTGVSVVVEIWAACRERHFEAGRLSAEVLFALTTLKHPSPFSIQPQQS